MLTAAKLLGIFAILYVIALYSGSHATTFNYSLALAAFSPVLIITSVVGLVLSILCFNKSKQSGHADLSLIIVMVLNVIGIIAPFMLPFFIML